MIEIALVKMYGVSLQSNAFENHNWLLSKEDTNELLKKIDHISNPLGNYLSSGINYGIKTGFNDAFVIDENTRNRLIAEDPKNGEIIKPVIVGDDIRKYEINYQERYLIFTRRGIEIDNYPVIERYLQQFKERLTPKRNMGEKIGRKPGRLSVV